jgi:hypothetical protein
VTLTSITPGTAAQGSPVTLAGSGFTGTSVVVFTTNSGTATVTPSAQLSTSLTATVPSNGITGPVLVQNGASSSSPVILQVTGPGGAAIQTAVAIGAGATVAGTDIYVPPPSTSLAFVDIGAGAPGTVILAGFNSATVLRGSTQQLLIVGSGLTAATTVTVSGTGVTLGSPQISGANLFINITVDAAAVQGYRNVTVTNSSGDLSIMTGGLLIQ